VRRSHLALAALTALAALVRFAWIGDQSFWLDEAFTAGGVDRGFGGLLSWVADHEATPPLYYALAWLWARLFGDGEVALRSLSAVLGTAAVPVAFLAARELFDRRTGLVAAALVAVNPFFVWYSQEARSYSLLVLMAALSLLAWARALNVPSAGRLAIWAAVGALALLTHWFAAFLLLPEAAWLAWRLRSRQALLAVGGLGAAALLLSPLALAQRGNGVSFIEDLALRSRVLDLPKKLVTGELGTPTPLIGPLAGLLVAAAIAYGLSRARLRRTQLVLLGVAAATAAVPLLLMAAGLDYLLPRNLIAMYVPLLIAAAAGFAAAGRLGIAGAGAVCAIAVVVNVEVAHDDALQRTDWRRAAGELGEPAAGRAIVVTPLWDDTALRHYAGPLPDMASAGAAVTEVVAIGEGQPPAFSQPPPPPGFRVAERLHTPSFELIRYVSDHPRQVTPESLAATRLGPKPAAFLIESETQ
jgi:4-amino-4-deoxy-L-arabinose transferase-like glycosyltransferase